ncbi:hypothetical protein Q9R08_05180 [Microbacterium sp. QXD-8]|uniref:Uncharacterized protein n=1 Tax=Microbacterium psychrotolerans TaxID=3068321 RepID=A0ABU0Z1F4_9MICO|nr:hypothetical protein [Microbacterium sp. QXD-8]MDQ7877366.1 hypothetical protein [Microbacterium sp. QXD-8]
MAKIRKDLFGSVLVDNPTGGDPLVLVAGDEVPEGVALGDHVLAKEKSGDSDDDSGKAAKAAAKAEKKAAKSASPAAPSTGSETGDVVVPPQTGRGSGDAAWRDYAKAATAKAGLSIELADDAKKADIIEALKAADIPVV